MKKMCVSLLAGAMALSLAACGGQPSAGETPSKSTSLSDDEIIAAAKAVQVPDFPEALGTYIDSAEEVPERDWYIVTEENTDEDTLDDLEDFYDPETEQIVCADIGTFDIMFYIVVDNATGDARLLTSHSSYGDDERENLASFLTRSTAGALSAEELEDAVMSSHLPGYPDRTLGQYVEQATMVAGSSSLVPLPLNQMNQLLLIYDRCPDFDIIADDVRLLTVWKDDLQGNHQLTYRFYVAVDRNAGESMVAAASAAAWENGREGDTATRYGDEVEQIADIFVDGANWAS